MAVDVSGSYMLILSHRMTYVFKIYEGIADTKQSGLIFGSQLEHLKKTYLQLLAKSGQCLESARL